MKRGLSATALAITTSIVLIASLISFVIYRNTFTPKVKGTSSLGEVIKPGFSVDVVSQKGTWELYVFLCEDKDGCTESLDSGVRWLTRGGGQTEDSEVFVEARDSWKKYEYIKLFVKPGWGSEDRNFVGTLEDVPLQVESVTIDDFDVVVIPTTNVQLEFYKVVTFSD